MFVLVGMGTLRDESSEYPYETCVLDILGMSLLKYKGGTPDSGHLNLSRNSVTLLGQFLLFP